MRYGGIVQKGGQRGTELGFPTVNIPLDGTDVAGVFAANVFTDGHTYAAALYADPRRNILEAHLLDVSEDLYGKEIEIELLEKIRDDKKFDNEASLKQAIADDVAKVREYFKQ